MKTWIVIFLLLLGYASGFSQSDAKWTLSIAPQAGKIFIIDKDFSSLSFSSILPGAGLSLKYERPHTTQELSFTYLSGTLKTSTEQVYHLDQHYYTIDYTGLYKLGAPDAAWTGGVGGTIQVLYNDRSYPELINSNSTYDFAASLGLAGRLAYSFNNVWSLTESLNIPFLTWLSEPDDRHSITSFSSFLRFKNAASLNRQLSTHGALSLAYSWDYYRIQDLREVRQASHCIELIYHITF